jgi:hypothetical protein
MRGVDDTPLVFDRTLGTLDCVYRFLDTINCPKFKYEDVLWCWGKLVGAEWIINDPTPRRAPPIPTRSEIERAERAPEPSPPPPSTSAPEITDTSDDADSDSREELPPPKNVAPTRKKRRCSRHGRPWTDEEDAALIRAIRTCGWGRWKQMTALEPALHDRDATVIASHVQWLQRSRKYGDLKRLQ